MKPTEDMERYIPAGEDVNDYVPVHNGDEIVGVVRECDIDEVQGASYGGAWLGTERLIGFALYEKNKIVVVNDGNYDYGRADYVIGREEEERFNEGKLSWDSEECRFVGDEEEETE